MGIFKYIFKKEVKISAIDLYNEIENNDLSFCGYPGSGKSVFLSNLGMYLRTKGVSIIHVGISIGEINKYYLEKLKNENLLIMDVFGDIESHSIDADFIFLNDVVLGNYLIEPEEILIKYIKNEYLNKESLDGFLNFLKEYEKKFNNDFISNIQKLKEKKIIEKSGDLSKKILNNNIVCYLPLSNKEKENSFLANLLSLLLTVSGKKNIIITENVNYEIKKNKFNNIFSEKINVSPKDNYEKIIFFKSMFSIINTLPGDKIEKIESITRNLMTGECLWIKNEKFNIIKNIYDKRECKENLIKNRKKELYDKLEEIIDEKEEVKKTKI